MGLSLLLFTQLFLKIEPDSESKSASKNKQTLIHSFCNQLQADKTLHIAV